MPEPQYGEPWTMRQPRKYRPLADEGKCVFDSDNFPRAEIRAADEDEERLNGERIVACVNFCRHFTTEELVGKVLAQTTMYGGVAILKETPPHE